MMPHVTALLAALVLAVLAGCERAPEPGPASRPLVVATVYPLYEFARQVGGDRVEVLALVPPGVEPHDWEPSPRDVGRIQRARVFVYNGAGLEPWADRLRGDALGPDAVVVRATEGLPLAPAGAGHDGHDHGSGGSAGTDPHVWLDPVLAQAQVERIRAGLAAADPAGAAAYEAGARSYTEVLARLHAELEQGLADCARRDMVVSHAAFGYLARRYRLRQHAVLGLAPGAEPSPAEMADIVRFARRHGATHIFTETLVSSRLAETLAREVGARTLVLDPLEGLTPEAVAAGQDYVSVMRANLANLREGLGCH